MIFPSEEEGVCGGESKCDAVNLTQEPILVRNELFQKNVYSLILLIV